MLAPVTVLTESPHTILAEINAIPPLSPNEEQRLAAHAYAGDEGARAALVRHNLRLVLIIARYYAARGGDLADLIDEGTLGLLQAAQRYVPNSRYRFTTFASLWVRKAIWNAIANTARMIRLPQNILFAQRAIYRALSQAGRALSLQELATITKLSPVTLRAALHAWAVPVSLDHAAEGVKREMVSEAHALSPVSAPLADPAFFVEHATMLATVHQALRLAQLTRVEFRVIMLRYGFLDGLGRSFQEVGTDLGITRERAYQLEKRALHKLRQAISQHGLWE